VVKKRIDKKATDFMNMPPVVSEAYRTARTNLLFLVSANSCKRIIVSSSKPDEGKTTTSINLSMSFAMTSKKVLLIDCDMRNPTIHRYFDMRVKPGLSDILAGFAGLDDCINKTDVKNLNILTAGTIPPNPADLILLPKFQEILDSLSSKYDYIFIDTPPIGSYSDAISLSINADGVVLVANYSSTKRAELKNTVEKLKKVNARIFGIILNRYNTRKYYKQFGYYKYHKLHNVDSDNNK
jgi:capsular exopolysaccharide synthesis family protein